MAESDLIAGPESERLRDEWLSRLLQLLNDLRGWATDLGWATRLIEKRLDDPEIGTYIAPALLLQEDAVRVLVEPIARTAPGAEGIVDMYLMPAYDDIASIYYYDGGWHLHYMFADSATVATIRDAKAVSVTKETLEKVLSEMKQHAN